MPSLLVVDDDPNIRASLVERFRGRGFAVSSASSGREALAKLRREAPDAVLLDLQLPEGDGLSVLNALREEGLDVTVIVITAFGSVGRAVEAMRAGAWDFLVKPFEPGLVEETVRRALERTTLVRSARAAKSARRDPELVGLAALAEIAKKAARSDATVLLQGESGSGKEVLARAIHQWSARADGPFVALNTAAVPETLLESELFGHEKGAFTGAEKRRAGRFELAHGGTLFLDEVGDMSAAMQVKLLRVLETRAFERVGGGDTLQVDVRLVAATHRDLKQKLADGSFREDLYWRLNVVPLAVPPLRERRGDVRALALHFLGALRPAWSFDAEALGALERYDWPGNVRELRNVVERAVALGEGPALGVGDLPPELHAVGTLAPTSFHGQVEAFRKQVLKEALARHGGNQTRAAEALGLQRTYLARLIKQLGIHPDTR
ncbi:MAG: sigma-54-dependent Fis family transcriptional regulator [Planctomycetes bacterium]|nr:sigma-54-dependent Fis family transcriptional regulator [Planctomycetota bacterium]